MCIEHPFVMNRESRVITATNSYRRRAATRRSSSVCGAPRGQLNFGEEIRERFLLHASHLWRATVRCGEAELHILCLWVATPGQMPSTYVALDRTALIGGLRQAVRLLVLLRSTVIRHVRSWPASEGLSPAEVFMSIRSAA